MLSRSDFDAVLTVSINNDRKVMEAMAAVRKDEQQRLLAILDCTSRHKEYALSGIAQGFAASLREEVAAGA